MIGRTLTRAVPLYHNKLVIVVLWGFHLLVMGAS